MTWIGEIRKFETWLNAAGMARSTVKLRVYYIGRFATWCYDDPEDGVDLRSAVPLEPWTVTVDDLAAFLANPGWLPETRKSALASVRAFYAWGYATEKVHRNHAAHLPSVRVPQRRVKATPEAILNEALRRSDDKRRLMLLLGAKAGLRRAEIAAQSMEALRDLRDLRIIGKGSRERFIPIHQALAHELAAELERRDRGEYGTGFRYQPDESPWLFPGQSAGHVTADCVGKNLKSALGGYSSHTLRHRFATTIYRRTRDLRALQELLGHTRLETTGVYIDVDHDELRATVNAA